VDLQREAQPLTAQGADVDEIMVQLELMERNLPVADMVGLVGDGLMLQDGMFARGRYPFTLKL